MPTGKLAQWNPTRGFGFIAAKPRDCFVHLSAFEEAGLTPVVGMYLSYEVAPSPRTGKRCGVNLQALPPQEAQVAKREAEVNQAWASRDARPAFMREREAVPTAPSDEPVRFGVDTTLSAGHED